MKIDLNINYTVKEVVKDYRGKEKDRQYLESLQNSLQHYALEESDFSISGFIERVLKGLGKSKGDYWAFIVDEILLNGYRTKAKLEFVDSQYSFEFYNEHENILSQPNAFRVHQAPKIVKLTALVIVLELLEE